MAVLRAFIAIELPDEVEDQLQNVSISLQNHMEGMAVRWTKVENIHLTLKFLGDVSEKNVALVKEIMKTETAQQNAFEVSIGSLGVFPNKHSPRVLWVGVEAPPDLAQLQSRLEAETARMGYPPDQRKFMPHLTIGRVARNATPLEVREISQAIRKEKLGFLGVARVDKLTLFRSDLQPGGAVYTKLFTSPLTGE